MSRARRNAVSAFTRVLDALWRCDAEPGPLQTLWSLAVPGQHRSIACRGATGTQAQSTNPFPTSHFSITSATAALFLSCISMCELPLMPRSGSEMNSYDPPAAFSAAP